MWTFLCTLSKFAPVGFFFIICLLFCVILDIFLSQKGNCLDFTLLQLSSHSPSRTAYVRSIITPNWKGWKRSACLFECISSFFFSSVFVSILVRCFFGLFGVFLWPLSVLGGTHLIKTITSCNISAFSSGFVGFNYSRQENTVFKEIKTKCFNPYWSVLICTLYNNLCLYLSFASCNQCRLHHHSIN